MADTRVHDRNDLGKARDSARSTTEKQKYDRMLYKINHESKAVNRLREQLIKAVRGGDTRAMNYYNDKLSKHGR